MEFSPEKLHKGQNVLIYGASVYGELAYRGLEVLGIRPAAFIDRARKGGISVFRWSLRMK